MERISIARIAFNAVVAGLVPATTALEHRASITEVGGTSPATSRERCRCSHRGRPELVIGPARGRTRWAGPTISSACCATRTADDGLAKSARRGSRNRKPSRRISFAAGLATTGYGRPPVLQRRRGRRSLQWRRIDGGLFCCNDHPGVAGELRAGVGVTNSGLRSAGAAVDTTAREGTVSL
jgi:hypothetical protein